MIKPNEHNGFSVLESLVALVILGTSLGAILASMKMSSGVSALSGQKIEAGLIAESLITQERLNTEHSYRTYSGNNGRFNWQVRLEQLEIEDLAKLNARVFWSWRGIEQDIVLETFIFIRPVSEEN